MADWKKTFPSSLYALSGKNTVHGKWVTNSQSTPARNSSGVNLYTVVRVCRSSSSSSAAAAGQQGSIVELFRSDRIVTYSIPRVRKLTVDVPFNGHVDNLHSVFSS